MSNANTVAVFGSWDANDRVYTRLLDFSLGKPQRTRESYGGPGIDIAAGGPIDESAWVESRWTIEVKGTSVDDVSARIAALAAELRDLSTITVGLKGSDYTGTLIPKVAECVERPVTPISSVAGIYPESGVAITKFVRKAVDLSWDTGSATTDSAGWPDGTGNTLWRTNSSSGATASVDVTDLGPGSYAVFANAKRDSGADPATVATSVTEAVDIDGTSLRRHLLGIVSLPLTAVRGSATSSLAVVLTSDGTDYAYLNTVEFVPVSWGCWGWHHATPASSCDELCLEDGVTYADDAASLAYVQLGQQLKSLGGTLVVTAEGTTAAPVLVATASVEYAARWQGPAGA